MKIHNNPIESGIRRSINQLFDEGITGHNELFELFCLCFQSFYPVSASVCLNINSL